MRSAMSRRGRWWVFAGMSLGIAACVLQTETVSGPKGDPGSKGDPGAPGVTTVLTDGGAVSIQDLADLVVAQQESIAALQAQVQALDNLEVCGWFEPAHATNCSVECQNFSQMAHDAGWSRCLPKSSTGIQNVYGGRQFYIDAQCSDAHAVTDGYFFWEKRFKHLVGIEAIGDQHGGPSDGALFLKWNGCNTPPDSDIIPAFWCCK